MPPPAALAGSTGDPVLFGKQPPLLLRHVLSERENSFLSWCEQHGAKQLADGLGMLVGQAAHAVLLWHGVLPAVEPVIEKLKQELTA